MDPQPSPDHSANVPLELPATALPGLLALAATLVGLELGFGLLGDYGLFIDEFYYLACAARLDWGFVDHPPLAPAVLRAVVELLGENPLALRLPAALAGGVTVMLTGLLARRFGAAAFGQCMAGLAVLIAPIPLILFGFFSMNAFEILLWTGAAYLLVLIEQRRQPGLWWAFGLLAGVALLNKHTFVLFAIGLAVGVLATGARRHLHGRDLWLGVIIAAVVVAPNLVWQVQHDWASLEFYAAAGNKNLPTPPLEVLAIQVLTMNPANLVLWATGLGALLFSRRFAAYRHLGWLAATLIALAMAAQQSRPDRLAGIYPLLFAAGAAVFDRQIRQPGRGWLRTALPAFLALGGLPLLPIGLPVLPPETMARYVAALGVVPQIEAGEGKTAELPQWYADRFGWHQLAAEVDQIVAELPAAERSAVVVFAPSYGQAGALELYASTPGLQVYSTHNNYFLWGPPPEAPVAVVIGDTRERLEELFGEVRLAMVHDCQWCLRWRDQMPIWIVRRPHRPIAERWPELVQRG